MDKKFISKYDVRIKNFDYKNPLTIGNGDFAFTCDITGLQTFYEDYKSIPLCTMTNLFWAKQKGKGELPFQVYRKRSDGCEVRYMTDVNADNYDDFRDDCFKFDLFKLIFLMNGQPLSKKNISNISQHLHLYDGIVTTEFFYKNKIVFVETKIPQSHHNLRIRVQTDLQGLQVQLKFLFPSSSIRGSTLQEVESDFITATSFNVKTDFVEFKINYKSNMQRTKNIFEVVKDSQLILSLNNDFADDSDMHRYFDLAKSIALSDEELNRRMVLSLYLLKVNTLGIYPPAETGLTCNSWYGKFHLEMHLWHHLGLIRFGLYSYVLPSLKWYLNLLESSKKRAEEQGYQGMRLPKMTDYRGLDTPSPIGCLLIWQMPHLFIMLDEILKQDSKAINIEEWFPLLRGLIDFIVSFYYLKNGEYHLDSPLIPANENVEYTCDTPIFEECYTIYAFEIFLKWKKKFLFSYDTQKLEDIILRHVQPSIKNGCYEAYVGCENTFTKYNYDHPMMIGVYSFFQSNLVQPSIIKNTLNKILKSWRMKDTWGWDFPMLAMSAYHIGDLKLAKKIIKMKAYKNGYLKNGHNPQLPKASLPVYLPGNGAFLLAISQLLDKKYE